MTVAAVVAAAGRGERLGGAGPKALELLGGRPLLVYAVQALAAADDVDLVVVAAPPDRTEATGDLLAAHHLGADLVVVAGGATRRESVRAALRVLPAEVTVVLVHDAARPLAPVSLVEAVAAAVRAGAAAVVPGLPVADTIKRVDGDVVVETVDRARLRAVQTPQGFRRDVLEHAHFEFSLMGPDPTDDAALVEALRYPVHVVPGCEEAFKVTRPLDLLLAEAVLARQEASGGR